ncbi:MAG: HlyD family secretion protein, partial [Burkholderiaceae bacterium]
AESAARAAVAAAREQLASNQSLTEGTSVAQHPSVQRAAARFKEAYVNYKRIDLPAPVSGYIARRSVQVGQRIAPGTPLMSIVPLDRLWVDANFKEVQLREMRIGQPVTLTADVYGKDVTYHGTVEGMGAGTGSAFALLPAQNATGNWIKVVQRVPVRIKLDPKELDAHPLRVGLSMIADVDIHDQSGKMLSSVPNAAPQSATQVFARDDSEADALVARIIADNIGHEVRTRPAVQKGLSARPVVSSAAARKPAA